MSRGERRQHLPAVRRGEVPVGAALATGRALFGADFDSTYRPHDDA